MKQLPLIQQPYVYVGKNDEEHKNGETYYVVETGNHWIKEYGFVVWVTTEEDKFTKDIDYCISMSVDYFNESFWRA